MHGMHPSLTVVSIWHMTRGKHLRHSRSYASGRMTAPVRSTSRAHSPRASSRIVSAVFSRHSAAWRAQLPHMFHAKHVIVRLSGSCRCSHQVWRVRDHHIEHAMELRRNGMRLAVVILREAAQRLEARVVLQQMRAQVRGRRAQRPEQRRAGHAGDGAAAACRARDCPRDGPRGVLGVPELPRAQAGPSPLHPRGSPAVGLPAGAHPALESAASLGRDLWQLAQVNLSRTQCKPGCKDRAPVTVSSPR